MKRIVLLSLCLFLLCCFPLLSCPAFADTVIKEVTSPAGFLKTEGGRWAQAKKGQLVEKGNLLKTLAGGSIVLEDEARGATLHIAENSSVSFLGPDSHSVFQYKVRQGTAKFDLKKKIELEVDTPLVVFAVRGTIFEVRVSLENAEVTLNVSEGEVVARDVAGSRSRHSAKAEPAKTVALSSLGVTPSTRAIYQERIQRLIEKEKAAGELMRMSMPRGRSGSGGGNGGENGSGLSSGGSSPGGGDNDGGDDDGDGGDDN